MIGYRAQHASLHSFSCNRGLSMRPPHFLSLAPPSTTRYILVVLMDPLCNSNVPIIPVVHLCAPILFLSHLWPLLVSHILLFILVALMCARTIPIILAGPLSYPYTLLVVFLTHSSIQYPSGRTSFPSVFPILFRVYLWPLQVAHTILYVLLDPPFAPYSCSYTCGPSVFPVPFLL